MIDKKCFLLLTDDANFVAQISAATQESVQIGLTEQDKKYFYPRYKIAIVDCTSLVIDKDLLNMLEKLAKKLVLVTNAELNQIEAFADKALDIWQKPMPPIVLQKRLANILSHISTRAEIGALNFLAHEIQNPLASIQGYSSVMLSGFAGNLTEQQRNFLNIIQRNGIRVRRALVSFKDWYRIDANEYEIELESFVISEITDEIIKSKKRFEDIYGLAIQISIADNLPRIIGDKYRLVDAIDNLFNNAYGHSNNYLRFTVSTRNQDLVFALESDSTVEPTKISNYFVVNWEESKITQHIIEAHGGRIWLESEIGKGSTLYFTLPIAQS